MQIINAKSDLATHSLKGQRKSQIASTILHSPERQIDCQFFRFVFKTIAVSQVKC